MKKCLCLVMIGLVLLTGCGNDSRKSDDVKGITENVVENETTDVVPTTEEVKDTTTTTKKNSGNNTTKGTQSTSNKVVTTAKETTTKKTTSCKKVFKNRYSVVASDKATCEKEGNLKFLELSDKGEDVFAYECEEIKDACGDTYYGAFYWRYDYGKSTEVKVYR